MKMIDPKTVYLSMPCGDGRNMSETTAALIRTASRYAAFSFPAECSHVQLVRNYIASGFMRSGLEWLVCVDSDIYFEPQDFDLLMQPTVLGTEPLPTRVEVELIVGRDVTTGELRREKGLADALVCAEYPFKNDSCEPVKLGMGFVRAHRSVFQTLQDLKHTEESVPHVEIPRALFNRIKEAASQTITNPDGCGNLLDDIVTQAIDHVGAARLPQMTYKGALVTDFFPSGFFLNTIVPTTDWKGEDHGFWTLCMIAGLIPRIETRTRLTHIGRKGYVYDPNAGGGQ